MDEGSGFTNISSNESSLCAARTLQGPYLLPLSHDIMLVVRSFQFVYFFILLSAGGILNLAIVWVVIRNRNLRTLDVAISLQVVFISLVTIVLVILPALVNVSAGYWVFDAYGCSIQGFVEHTMRSARRVLIVAMVLDRFLLVFFPFTYGAHQTKAVILFSVLAWVFTLLFRITALPGLLDCFTISSTGVFCSFVARCSKWCAILGYLDFALFHLPFYTLPVILYSVMYRKAKMLKRLNNNSNGSKNASWKANITFFLLFVTSFVCNVPNISSILALQIVLAVKGFSFDLRISLFVLAHTILLLVVMDAVVLLRHRDIKKAIAKTLRPGKVEIGGDQ